MGHAFPHNRNSAESVLGMSRWRQPKFLCRLALRSIENRSDLFLLVEVKSKNSGCCQNFGAARRVRHFNFIKIRLKILLLPQMPSTCTSQKKYLGTRNIFFLAYHPLTFSLISIYSEIKFTFFKKKEECLLN